MTIEIKHQETVTVSVTNVKLPIYFLANQYEYSKKCYAVMEDLTMVSIYMSETYNSISMEPGTAEKAEKMLSDAFTKYPKRTEITETEFRSLFDEFNQKILSNQTK